jgi:hypothetical protein
VRFEINLERDHENYKTFLTVLAHFENKVLNCGCEIDYIAGMPNIKSILEMIEGALNNLIEMAKTEGLLREIEKNATEKIEK